MTKDPTTAVAPVADEGAAAVPAAPHAPKTRRRVARRAEPVYVPTKIAAPKLGLDVNSLRARCRRAAHKEGDAIVAHLGGDIYAIKLGRSWRVRFGDL